MRENFDRAFLILCQLEGYDSNVKGDPGGRTIWGISEKWFPAVVERLVTLTEQQAKEEARAWYLANTWKNLSLDTVKHPLDIMAFCQGVNMPTETKKFLVETDDWKDFLFKCLMYYSKLVEKKPELGKFLRGWINRVITLWLKFKREG